MSEKLIYSSMDRTVYVCRFNINTWHMITHKNLSAHYTPCFFQYCLFVETVDAGIISSLLQENVSEMDLDTLNEEIVLSL